MPRRRRSSNRPNPQDPQNPQSQPEQPKQQNAYQQRPPRQHQPPRQQRTSGQQQSPGQPRPQSQQRPLRQQQSPRQHQPPRQQRQRRQENHRGNFDINRPAPSVPIHTNRGIKARSQRGSFSKNWWARRWIEAMELLVDPARLQRGRSYARTGQVLTIQETQDGIQATVQGSRPQPYQVAIQVTPLTDQQWDQVIDALSEQALFTAQLLAGEMPGNIEDAFQTAGVSLFPSQAGDLLTSCSCPDWANPCKHVAATHYILGDRFDDDPFLLFRMRGRSQEQILQALRARRAGEASTQQDSEAPQIEEEQPTALEESIDQFWEPAESLDTFPLTIKPATINMPLLKRLGEPNFISEEVLQNLLKPVYENFMRSALLAAYSEEEPVEPGNGNGNGSSQEYGE